MEVDSSVQTRQANYQNRSQIAVKRPNTIQHNYRQTIPQTRQSNQALQQTNRRLSQQSL